MRWAAASRGGALLRPLRDLRRVGPCARRHAARVAEVLLDVVAIPVVSPVPRSRQLSLHRLRPLGIAHRPIEPASVETGDAIILSGDIGRHGIAIMAVREGLAFETTIQSDCAPLSGLVTELIKEGIEIHCMRDLTRGGLASALVEIAEASNLHLHIEERAIPTREDVKGACEILGLDPLYVAMATDHPLAKRSDLQLSDLASTAIVLGSMVEWEAYRWRLTELFSGEGMELRAALEAPDTPALVGLVVAGLGVTICPESLIGFFGQDVATRRINRPGFHIQTVLSWRRANRSEIVRQFVDVAQKIVPKSHPLMCTLHQTGDIGQHDLAVIQFSHTQIGRNGCEGVVGDFGLGRADYAQQCRFTGIGHADDADISDQL